MPPVPRRGALAGRGQIQRIQLRPVRLDCPATSSDLSWPWTRSSRSQTSTSASLIFGADELARSEVAVKDLRDAGAGQTTRVLADLPTWAAGLLKT